MTTWKERLESAKERGMFTEEDKIMAESWLTCAVGEREDVEKGRFGRPLSAELMDLGNQFDVEIHFHQIANATRIYEKIRAFKGRRE